MKPKKLLFVITKATRGGAQKYLYDLVTHLPEDDFDITVAYGEHGRLAEDLKAAGIRMLRVPSLGRDVSLLSDVRTFFALWKLFRAERADVVHLNSSKAAALGALAARLARIKTIIFTVHGWPFKESRNFVSNGLIYFISWLTACWSTKTIVVSKIDFELGRYMSFCKNKIVYIPLGIEQPNFFSREEASQRLKIDTLLPRIVTNAELTKNKGIRYAIEAIAALKKQGATLSYFLISDGEDRGMLERLAREKGVADQVRFLGFVPEAARYLKAFDLFLLPSIKEGMPYVLLEAAAAQLPIVTTNIVDPLFLGAYENVRAVPPANTEALAAAILETMEAQQEKPLFPATEDNTFSQMIDQTVGLY